MRRILVNAARRKGSLKRGASFSRVELGGDLISDQSAPEDLVAVSEALDSLAEHDSQKAELVKLLFFAGLPVQEAATALGISRKLPSAIGLTREHGFTASCIAARATEYQSPILSNSVKAPPRRFRFFV